MSKLHRYDLEHMLSTDPPKVPWVVRNVAAIGEVTVLYGVGGIGKSMLALGLADGVSRGPSRVAGLPCAGSRAAYIDAENGEWETHRRVQAFDVNPERLAMFDATAIHLTRDYDEIEKAIRKHRPRLVVLDSLRRLLPGVEENDSGAMAEALGYCKQLAQACRTAVVVIHHSKKATDAGETYRGSSAIHDQASIVYRLSREKGDIDRTRRVLVNEKMRIGPEPPPRHLRIAFGNGAVDLSTASRPSDGEVAPGNASAEIIPKALEILGREPRTRSKVAEELGRIKSDNTIRRVFKQLEGAGHIHQDDKGLWHRVATEKPHSAQNGKGVAKDVATGKGMATTDGKGVAKAGRARQRRDGNPTRKGKKR